MSLYFRRALWYNAFGIVAIVVLCGYAGMVIFAYYQDELCDPIKSKVGTVISSTWYSIGIFNP